MTILSLTYQLSSWGENSELLKGTTTPRVHAKQLWCTLGVVVLELSVWPSLRVFWVRVKVSTGVGCNVETLYSPYLFLLLHSHMTPCLSMLRHTTHPHLRMSPTQEMPTPCPDAPGRGNEGPHELLPCPLPSRLVPSLYGDQRARSSPTLLSHRL